MPVSQIKQSIDINASIEVVDRCITDRTLMHRWLNPLLRCEPVGAWSTDVGSRSRFVIQIPFVKPTLHNIVIERSLGLVVWEFQGFFQGRDRWECQPRDRITHLVNNFEFEIPHPVVRWGFNIFALALTQKDMQDQLRRLKRLAEEIAAPGKGE
ncbi:SRPBCC family protein [Chroococcidiopsis sp. TS-821]|uniref:SRPBCC family protein n=1 Tax=Chroococcidiopsis sp. TS-821 TaxID=1378066 RepID=UPI000CEF416D|nr:SRPBCC family protein [Chroococcidiopsis sp. TS-821]PPS39158.1 polyketide cyclase [Chroococcidiopsis sp. TS-821]